MATNKILPFADTAAAGDILTDAQYASDARRNSGHVRGIASKELANKSTKQAAAVAAGVGQFVADNQSADVTDADTPAGLAAKITNALKSLFALKSHGHAISDVTQLQTALDAKYDKTGGNVSGPVTASGVVQGSAVLGAGSTAAPWIPGIIAATVGGRVARLIADVNADGSLYFAMQAIDHTQTIRAVPVLQGMGPDGSPRKLVIGQYAPEIELGVSPIAGAAGLQAATASWVNAKIASDRRLKSDLKPVGSTLERLAGITAYTYDMQGFAARKLGSIAQDWQVAFPEAVSHITWDDGKPAIGVEPLSAIAVLVEAVNELSARVKALEAK